MWYSEAFAPGLEKGLAILALLARILSYVTIAARKRRFEPLRFSDQELHCTLYISLCININGESSTELFSTPPPTAPPYRIMKHEHVANSTPSETALRGPLAGVHKPAAVNHRLVSKLER